MANLSPVTDTGAAASDLTAIAQRDSSAEVVVVGALTKGLAGEQLSDIDGLHAAGVTMFSDDGRCVMNAQLMREAFEKIKAFDGVLAQHCQDHNLAGAEASCHECAISARLGLPGWPLSLIHILPILYLLVSVGSSAIRVHAYSIVTQSSASSRIATSR